MQLRYNKDERRKHMDIGDLIKEQRKKRGLSQSELAEKLNVKTATISKYEKNKIKNIPYNRLMQLSHALGISEREIVMLALSNGLISRNELDEGDAFDLQPKRVIDLSSNNFAYVYKGRKVTSAEMIYTLIILNKTA